MIQQLLNNVIVPNSVCYFTVGYLAGYLTHKYSSKIMYNGFKYYVIATESLDKAKGRVVALCQREKDVGNMAMRVSSMVINFEIPYRCETYIHRIGRSGRYGRKGVGINLVTDGDHQKFQQIETFYSCKIDVFPKDFQKYL